MTTWNVNWKAVWQYPLKLSLSALWHNNSTPEYISNRVPQQKNEQIIVFLLKGILYWNENEQTIAPCNNMDELYKNNLEQKEPDTKEYYCMMLFT